MAFWTSGFFTPLTLESCRYLLHRDGFARKERGRAGGEGILVIGHHVRLDEFVKVGKVLLKLLRQLRFPFQSQLSGGLAVSESAASREAGELAVKRLQVVNVVFRAGLELRVIYGVLPSSEFPAKLEGFAHERLKLLFQVVVAGADHTLESGERLLHSVETVKHGVQRAHRIASLEREPERGAEILRINLEVGIGTHAGVGFPLVLSHGEDHVILPCQHHRSAAPAKELRKFAGFLLALKGQPFRPVVTHRPDKTIDPGLGRSVLGRHRIPMFVGDDDLDRAFALAPWTLSFSLPSLSPLASRHCGASAARPACPGATSSSRTAAAAPLLNLLLQEVIDHHSLGAIRGGVIRRRTESCAAPVMKQRARRGADQLKVAVLALRTHPLDWANVVEHEEAAAVRGHH